MFDGAALKLEFVVKRLDQPKPRKRATGRKFPSCRLVLHPNGATELYNQLHQLIAALERAGAVTRQSPVNPATQPTIQ